MKLLSEQKCTVLCWCLSSVLFIPAAAYAQMNPNADPSSAAQANGGFVFLNSNVAAMAEQAYGLPKATQSYPLAGMTVFPYYQASEPLKAFLNTTTFMGKPITAVPFQPQIPQISLPMTDLVRRSIPIPNMYNQKRGAVKMEVIDKKNRDEVPWMVAHQGGQAFQIPGDADALALVAQGSMFSACATRTMVLRCGLMWIMTGARPAAVLTKDAAVMVKPYGIAAIETTWFNQMRVVNFAGQAVEIQLAHDGKADKISVEKGKEIAVSEIGPANGKLEEMKNGGSSPIQTTVTSLAVNGAAIEPKTNEFLKELTTITPPFNNPKMSSDYTRMFASYGITPQMRGEAIRRQMISKSNIATKAAMNNLARRAPITSTITANRAALGPADGVSSAAASSQAANSSALGGAGSPPSLPMVARPATTRLEELRTLRLAKGKARVFASSEINIEQNGRPYFTQGEAVFIAREPMVIRTNTFSVHLRAGAKVNMVARKDVILVRNLGEEQADSVKIRMGDHIFDCGVGGELVAGSSAPAIFDEMRIDGIARRNVQSTEAVHGTVVINKGEVSLTSLMQKSAIMRKLYKSSDEGDKQLIADLMKTIVAMDIVTSGRGSYRSMSGLSGVH